MADRQTSQGAVQCFYCRRWSDNQLWIRPSWDAEDVADGLWFTALSASEEDDCGAVTLLDVNSVRALHGLLGEWLASKAWPVEAALIGEQAPPDEPGFDDPNDDPNSDSYFADDGKDYRRPRREIGHGS